MDRDYWIVSFVIAAAVTTVVLRVVVSRIDGWQLLDQEQEDPRSRVFSLAAVVLLLWLTATLLAQIVSTSANAINQWFVFSDVLFDSSRRIRMFSVTNGLSTGVQLGVALGLIEYVVRALAEVRTLSASAPADLEDQDTSWLGPAEE